MSKSRLRAAVERLIPEKVLEAMANHPKGKPLELNERGAGAYEVPDPTPMAPPVGYKRQPSIFEQQRDMMRAHFAAFEKEGFESPEEADDFNVGDDYDPTSPYEHNFDPPAPVQAPAQAPLRAAPEPASAPSPAPAPAPASPPITAG